MNTARLKKGSMIMASIIGTLLTVILIFWGLKAISSFRMQEDNSDRLEEFIQDLNSFSRQEGIQDPIKNYMELGTSELFLFFSAGAENIYLHDKDGKPFLEFTRPDDPSCDSRACVCYCNDGPFWQKADEKPYLEPHLIHRSKNFSCYFSTCMATEEPNLVFGNSRGEDDYFTQEMYDLADFNDNKNRRTTLVNNEEFTPLPMDIVTLINSQQFDGKNIFFDRTNIIDCLGKNYHFKCVDEDISRYLTQDFSWQGGIVLGGMGASRSKNDMKKHRLLPTYFSLQFQEVTSEGLVGVCLHLDDCMGDTAQKKYQKEIDNAKALEEFKIFSRIFEHYIKETFPSCLEKKDQTRCVQELDHLAFQPFFKKIHKTTSGKTKIVFYADNEKSSNSQVWLYFYNGVDFKKIASIDLHYPAPLLLQKDGTPYDFISNLALLDMDETTNTFTFRNYDTTEFTLISYEAQTNSGIQETFAFKEVAS